MSWGYRGPSRRKGRSGSARPAYFGFVWYTPLLRFYPMAQLGSSRDMIQTPALTIVLSFVGALCLSSIVLSQGLPIPYGPTTMVSALPSGFGPPGGLGFVQESSISNDGSRIAFVSTYPYDPADLNGGSDVYLYDEASGQVSLISRAMSGTAGGGGSPRLSSDGMKVIFIGSPLLLIPGELGQGPGVIMADLSAWPVITFVRLERRFDQAPLQWSSRHSSASSDLNYVVVTAADPLTPPAPGENRVFNYLCG